MAERKLLGRLYTRGEPRAVRFGGPQSTRTTLCIADMLRDILEDMVAEDTAADGTEPVGWSKSELARQLKMPLSSLSHILKGTRQASLETLERLAALQNSNDPITVLLTHSIYADSRLRDDLESGINPWADLRIRGNTTSDQRERIGRALEAAAAAGGDEEFTQLAELVGKSYAKRPRDSRKR